MRVRNRLPPSFWLIRQYSVDCFAVRPWRLQHTARGGDLVSERHNAVFVWQEQWLGCDCGCLFFCRFVPVSIPIDDRIVAAAACCLSCTMRSGIRVLVRPRTESHGQVHVRLDSRNPAIRIWPGSRGLLLGGRPGLLAALSAPQRARSAAHFVPVRFLSSRSSRPPCRPTLRQLCGTALVVTFPGWLGWLLW